MKPKTVLNSFGIPKTKPAYHEGKEVFINEPGLFCLIMNSRAPFAEKFQDLVYEQILPSIRKRGRFQLEQTIVQKDDAIDKLRKELQVQHEELMACIHDLRYQNDELLESSNNQTKELHIVQNKLGIAVKDRAPLPREKNKQERFVLIKRFPKRYGSTPEYKYYAIRAQDLRVKQSLNIQQSMYDIKILLDMSCHPNSRTLFNRIKEELKEKGVEFSYNNMCIAESKVDEEKLIATMRKVDEKKLDV